MDERQRRPDGADVFRLEPTTLPVKAGGRFPVRRIYCIGRNYAEHTREMGGDPKTEAPFFFQKPADAVQAIPEDEITDHPYPPLTRDYHHEVELVVLLGSGGRDIAPERALDHVWGYAVGLDMTRRDAQGAMKDKRRPWEIGKSFDRSAPVGPVIPVAACGHLAGGVISLAVNGAMRQRGDLADMIWTVPEQIAELSRGSELKAGDIIMTGTPAGVGPVMKGDEIVATIDGLPELKLRIV